MKTIDCRRCREKIAREAKAEYLNHEFDIFEDVAQSMATYAICGILTVMSRRGRTKKYISQLYDDMCTAFEQDKLFDKNITMEEIMEALSKEYGIDWDRVNPKLETRKEFFFSMRAKS